MQITKYYFKLQNKKQYINFITNIILKTIIFKGISPMGDNIIFYKN